MNFSIITSYCICLRYIRQQRTTSWEVFFSKDTTKKLLCKKYCNCHHDTCHNTEECKSFKAFVEKLINDEYLKVFIANHYELPNEQTTTKAIS